jgi:hypothetical protein
LTGSDMGLVDCPTVYVLDLWEAEWLQCIILQFFIWHSLSWSLAHFLVAFCRIVNGMRTVLRTTTRFLLQYAKI